MIDDLTASHLHRGMAKTAVRDLLGPPGEIGFSDAGAYDYCLGMWSGFGIDYEWLSLFFDRQGRLAEWSVWQD
jgi:hypothetical protein